MTEIADTLEDLTGEWFTAALRDSGMIDDDTTVITAASRFIGTGQLGSVARSELTYAGGDGPVSVVVKLPSLDPGSRQLGVAIGVYESEVRFYQEIAPTLAVHVPRLYWGGLEPGSGRFTLVLEDLSAGAEVGDMIAGATAEQTALALGELVGVQAPRWNDQRLRDIPWLADVARTQMLFAGVAAAVAPFEARFGDRLTPAHVDLVRRLAPEAGNVTGIVWKPPFVVCHGDYRLDNMIFGRAADRPPITVIDWQVTRLGPPLLDAAIFLSSCVDAATRRRDEDRLLTDYHARLLEAGVSGFGLDDVRESYRRSSLYPMLLAVAMSVTVEQTKRGDAMWTRLVSGAADLVLDTCAAEVLGR